MGAPYKVKITVVKKTFHTDLVDQYTDNPESWKEGSIGCKPNCCHSFDIGHEFISDGTHIPEGFPDPPWVDIQKYVFILGRGGNMLGTKPGTFISNCTDGFRPVTYKLERIED
ncbi:MAG: TIGR04076 family protein [SAR202 cluster bacterium]|nr:TIGR04076 family protein [SAR202 cluster bacterium]|tara:strand:- start:2040 stop:2378 length:339 start_codon:yes stop_codon:yes gene_type:complete